MPRVRDEDLEVHPLFAGATRPPMTWGVTYAGLVLNVGITAEIFLVTKNLLWLLAFFPLHAVLWAACKHEPRFFDLWRLWGRTRLPGHLSNLYFWRANSYSPLVIELPDVNGRRRRLWAPPARRP